MFSSPKKSRIVEKTHTLTLNEDKDAPVASTTTSAADTTTYITGKYPIFARWKEVLPKEDLRWISKPLFTNIVEKRCERAHMLTERIDKMWWSPPEPPFLVNSIPSVDHYFGHRLFLWMPHKLWHISLRCPL
ncbi:hypothetical protein DPMN_175831 [Dreissena polymorpha]|uniref:DUF6729 domain-containing protein n=1 Tax=Dreissena polymorpha TaxID=45954 RepID=A0A9D4E8V3_DREPO|nr:hypothetical protein DPMN_175831 [Dreissena polymorpha]